MYYQFTGQPGHGKTVLAIEYALNMKAKADKLHAEDPAKHPLRELYVCNVRDFNHGLAGAISVTPAEIMAWCDHPDYLAKLEEIHETLRAKRLTKEQFKDELEFALEAPDVQKLATEKINPAFENAIILVDEAYEHQMFPRRAPGRPIPRHVERVAKHRHFGIDFIMICQSPKKQMDDFLHDLIEEHYHIRRRYGLPFVHIKRWDRYEPNPDKADSLTTSRRKYPKHIFKLYTSTKYDTSSQKIPWFYYALGVLILAFIAMFIYNTKRLGERFGKPQDKETATLEPGNVGHGARATGPTGAGSSGSKSRGSVNDYLVSFTPRLPSQPWTAPAYDGLALANTAPRLFCMSSGQGADSAGKQALPSCTCLTEQGTPYVVERQLCAYIARNGQYEPFLASQQLAQGQSVQTGPMATAAPVTPNAGISSAGAVVTAQGGQVDTFPRSAGYKPGG